MKNIDKNLIDKYLDRRCSKQEARVVLEWFDTPEGAKHLEKLLDSDIDLALKDDDIRKDNSSTSETKPDSIRILSGINRKIDELENMKPQGSYKKRKGRKKDFLLPVIKVAATILVVFTASLFIFLNFEKPLNVVTETEPNVYSTSTGQQKRVTLSDGILIHLNSNSDIRVVSDPANGSRTVELDGEAYFNVSYNREHPFKVLANESVIEVLGTGFNVKSYLSQTDVQIAVVNGSVSVSTNIPDMMIEPMILEKGQFARLDLQGKEVILDNIAVDNYLVWMNGRLVFEDISLENVCQQLNRLYQIDCRFDSDSLKNLQLTANFSDDSLEKTLSVIALSLDLAYRKENNEVFWSVIAF